MSDPSEDAFEDRRQGRKPCGQVSIRDFDVGVIRTLGTTAFDAVTGKYAAGEYITTLTGSCPPDGLPGVPVVFGNPEDVFKNYTDPMILVTRGDISPALDRWHPGTLQYNAAGDGAQIANINLPGGSSVTGFDRAEVMGQAWPFDIMYTVSVRARFRGAGQRTNTADTLIRHVMRTYPPYGKVDVTDSIGDLRGYEAFNEGIATVDTLEEIRDREIGFAITLRVEAELDYKDAHTVRTVTRRARINSSQR